MVDSAYSNGLLEPAVNNYGINSEIDALFSIAISLKRIADHLEESKSTLEVCTDRLIMAINNSR